MNSNKAIFMCAIIFSVPLFAKKIKVDPFKSAEYTVRNSSWFKIAAIDQILHTNPHIRYEKCFGEVGFNFDAFSLSPVIPHKGYFKECFILEIPQGQVQGKEGIVLIDNILAQEMVWADRYQTLQNIPKLDTSKIQKISGRVAVIAQVAHDNYCHFFYEVLGRLAMLEMHEIAYDWLYVPCDKQFVKDGLKLWGIDESKIISPTGKDFCIQADTLMVPSLVLNTNNGFKHAEFNAHPYTLKYVRDKLLNKIDGKVDLSQYSKRIFISRRDAPSRKILNEDEIFELFQIKGFERYDTGKMSVLEQIALFAQAEIVVGEHGAGLTNILFCKKATKVIELFQALIDTSFWFPSQIFNLDYIPINSLDINADYFSNWAQINSKIYCKAQNSKINIPLEKIHTIIESL